MTSSAQLTAFLMVVMSLSVVGCNTADSDVAPSYMSAFIRADGKIQTAVSADHGAHWSGHVHAGSAGARYGVALAVNPDNCTLYYLAYFFDGPSGMQLAMETGLGNQNWNDAHPETMSYPSLSAPSMCYIGDDKFLIAWKESDGIGTVVYDAAAPDIPERRFLNRNDIDDDDALACRGSPAICCEYETPDKPTRMVWQHQDRKLRERIGRLRTDGTIDFAGSDTRTLLFPDSTIRNDSIVSAPDLFLSVVNDVEGAVIFRSVGSDLTGYDQTTIAPFLEEWKINNDHHVLGVMTPAPANIAMAGASQRPSRPVELEEILFSVCLLPAPHTPESVVRLIQDPADGTGEIHHQDVTWLEAFGDDGYPNMRPDLTFNPGR